MKRQIAVTALLLLTAFTVLAQEKPPEFNTTRDFKSKVFEVQNRDPRDLIQSLHLLSSGFKGADMNINRELRTITVRDFPENIAAIEDALKRLDRPSVPIPDIELRISVLVGSKTAMKTQPVPEDLAPVVTQLKANLRYSSYGLLTTTVHRTRPGRGIDASGILEPGSLGATTVEGSNILYTMRLSEVTAVASERPSVNIENFDFSMRVPLTTASGVQYQNVGFRTPVSIRDKEKVVIGTATLIDKALIVVVTATMQ